MKVMTTVVGEHHDREVPWPEGWPPPATGDQVDLFDGVLLHVRTVVWYPQGSVADEAPEPFVYVVLGQQRGLL